MASKKLSEFYSIHPWPDDPETKEGKLYFERTKEFMGRLLKHRWIERLLENGKVRILEVCGGSGFGGIALAKHLLERNVDVEILITDLREDALEKAKRWAEKLNLNASTMVMDAREIHNIKDSYDIALLYGLSTPHFDPWELVKLFSSVSWILNDEGIFIVDESDRRYRIFLNTGYRWTLVEGDGSKLSANFHLGYNLLRGTFRRVYLSLTEPSKPVEMETFMWGLAEVGALMWVFFRDVDLIRLKDDRYFVVGYHPRKRMQPYEFGNPSVFGYESA